MQAIFMPNLKIPRNNIDKNHQNQLGCEAIGQILPMATHIPPVKSVPKPIEKRDASHFSKDALPLLYSAYKLCPLPSENGSKAP